MSFPHNNVVEIGAKLVRRQTDDFAPGFDPSARTFGSRLLANAVPVVIDQERERLDPRAPESSPCCQHSPPPMPVAGACRDG
jgi:hypothetical protein